MELNPQHRDVPFTRVLQLLLYPLLFVFIAAFLPACDQDVPMLEYQALRALPHDTEAYTQGLLFHDGRFFESTGRLGASSVREVDPESGEVIQITSLSQEHFGEGLARVGTELIQLTWHAGLAFVYDVETLSLQKTFEYEGEGWGLCFDGEFLYMSDGTNRLSLRNPETFEVVDELRVTKGGYSVPSLNELECVGDVIYANVFQTNRIVRIDKSTGNVTGEIDGFQLSLGAERGSDPEAVLNGIAFDPGPGTLFVTGKLWDRIYELQVGGD
jgi:glutamine cyclotransferase